MKSIVLLFSLMFVSIMVSQKKSLADELWQEVGGRIDLSKQNEDDEYEIIDDAKNGYLKVAHFECCCGCYFETTVGAYKDSHGEYTTLKMDWDGCGWRKTLSSNKSLKSVLPEDFGLHTFLPKSQETEYQILSSVFYLEVDIPRKGTETQLDLTYIPFGIFSAPEDHILAYGYEQKIEHGGSNFLYSDPLKALIMNISNENTLECILEKSMDNIVPKDKELVEKLCGEGKQYRSIETLAARIQDLKTIYTISKDVEYKSVILDWDRDKAKFFVKEKIANDAPEMTFLEFLRQLPFLVAIC